MPHTPAELHAVAELAAALGIQPDETAAHRREQHAHPARASTRAKTVTAIG